MRTLLIKAFVKDFENTLDPNVRDRYGKLAGIVGILSNGILCLMKISVGLLFNSIAILADGINNLTDASSSAILLIGIRMAGKPADQDHPYGHARIEYITGLIISLLIIMIGIQLLISSIEKIFHPEPFEFSLMAVFVLIFSIGIKIWQAFFNTKIGEIISSSTIKATGADSRNDVITTSAVLLSLVIGRITGIMLDGIMGSLVALFILYSGVRLILETSAPLLGEAPDPKLVEEIQNRILLYEGVLGIHDLVVHNYGPSRIFASVHIEVDAHADLIASHDMIDSIERSIAETMKIQMVAHMDPLDTRDPLTAMVKEKLTDVIISVEGIVGIHDLRVVSGYSQQKVIFDVVVGPECNMKESEIKKLLDNQVKELSPNYYTVITVDRNYSN